MARFPKQVQEELDHYVYRLVDPRDGNTFYVGMGQKNRIFKQSAGRAIGKGLKGGRMEARRILNDIKDAGQEAVRIVHRSRMTKDQAKHVEAALIFAYPGATNARPKRNTPTNVHELTG